MKVFEFEHMIRCMLLFALWTSLTSVSLGQQPADLRVQTDRNEIQIADPFKLEIELLAQKGTQVNFPSLPNTIGSFEVLNIEDRFDIPITNDPGMRNWTRILTLETIETGELKIAGFEVSVTDLQNRTQFARSKPITIKVSSVVEADTDLSKFQDLAALHDVETATSSSFGWAWWATGAAAIALAFGGLLLLATRKPRSVSPSVWALKELEELPQKDVAQLEKILRAFIASRFEFPAESFSSEQTTTMLKDKNIAQDDLSSLQEILSRSERMKFGGVNLSESENQRLFDSGRQLIQQLDQHAEVN